MQAAAAAKLYISFYHLKMLLCGMRVSNRKGNSQCPAGGSLQLVSDEYFPYPSSLRELVNTFWFSFIFSMRVNPANAWH